MNKQDRTTTVPRSIFLGTLTIGLLLAAGTASAEHGHSNGRGQADNGNYDYARVVSADPVIRYVTVTTPVRECWQETRRYRTSPRRSNAGATLLGAIIGGVVGHQFGSGHGNDAATVAGTMIGAAIGSSARRRNGDQYEETYSSRPVQRCETRYEERQEERIDGYRVVYQYHGQKYATQMPYDPGRRLRIRVDVRPAR